MGYVDVDPSAYPSEKLAKTDHGGQGPLNAGDTYEPLVVAGDLRCTRTLSAF